MTCSEIQELSPLYQSGCLDAKQASEFAAHLKSCPDCELDQRVRASVLAEQIDTSRVELAVRNQTRPNPRSVPGWAVAAAAIIAAVLAAGLSYRTFLKEQTPLLCVDAAQDHQREIVNGEPRRWLSDLSAIEALAQGQGVPVSAISALGTTGYRLERGRLCFLKKQIYLHLVYTKGDGEFSVFLRPRASESFDASVRGASVGGEDVAYFQSDRFTAVFVAHQSGADVLAFARAGARVL